MRISDWSSDVCSSDLHDVAIAKSQDRALAPPGDRSKPGERRHRWREVIAGRGNRGKNGKAVERHMLSRSAQQIVAFLAENRRSDPAVDGIIANQTEMTVRGFAIMNDIKTALLGRHMDPLPFGHFEIGRAHV